jgi:DNA (cytosine-5)-methyltransferase 1
MNAPSVDSSGSPPTVISTFAGCGGSSLGYKLAGFKELLAVEWDDNAAETFRLNFPDMPVYHGDICKLTGAECMRLAGLSGPGVLDVLDGSPPCFPAGIDIQTECGRIPIEFCTAGMIVVSNTGRFRKIDHVMKRSFSGRIFRIATKYGRKPIVCTEEHPFWVRRRVVLKRDNKARKNSTSYKGYTAPEWISASQLQIGDMLCEPHIVEDISLEIPPVILKQRINQEGQSGTLKSEIRLLERECQTDWHSLTLAWLLGFYLAEGHTRGHNPILEKDEPCRREVIYSVADKEAVPLARRLADAGFHAIIQRHSHGSSRVSVSSMDLWALCQVMGKHADGKFVPLAFHTMQIEWQRAFLDGYFSGDGCFSASRRIANIKRKATTISWDIAIGIARMIATVYSVVATIEVLYPAGISIIQNRTVEVKQAYSVGYSLPNSNRIRPGFVDELGAWLPIKAIKMERVEGLDVYNAEVEQDHSYVAGGFAVHNCQGFSTAGKRKFDDPRNSLFREYARLLRELQPRVFVMENVTGMVKGAMKQAYLTIIAELRECGYRAKGEVLNAMYFHVPQSRERVIIIGVRKDLGIEPSHPKPQTRPVVCGDVLAEKDFDNTLTPDQYAVWVEKRRNTWRRSTWFNFEILNPREPSPTICKESGNAKFCHWDNPCAVGINGYKKLASFPDNFIFSGDYSHSKERIGNSVPPNLMRAIAEHIRFNILSQLQIRPSGGK